MCHFIVVILIVTFERKRESEKELFFFFDNVDKRQTMLHSVVESTTICIFAMIMSVTSGRRGSGKEERALRDVVINGTTTRGSRAFPLSASIPLVTTLFRLMYVRTFYAPM